MSALNETLATQIRLAKLPEPKREYRAIPGRRLRWDFAWPEHRLLAEVQGGTWSTRNSSRVSGHNSGVGIARDTEKLNVAALDGWTILQFTTDQIREGKALRWLQTFFEVA